MALKEITNTSNSVNMQNEMNLESRMCKMDGLGNKTDSISTVYNLIILDESGSMSVVSGQTISGCNETLNGIRSSAAEDKEQLQFVSIYCFDSTNSRYIIENTPIEKVKDMTSNDYSPNACTPLYDAIGGVSENGGDGDGDV